MCARLRRDPHIAVYSASRATEFGGFLSDYASHTSCGGRRLTAVGDDDLTNAVITAQKVTLGRPWLRLYHTAHAAPLEGSGRAGRTHGAGVRHSHTGRDTWTLGPHGRFACPVNSGRGAASSAISPGASDRRSGVGPSCTGTHTDCQWSPLLL